MFLILGLYIRDEGCMQNNISSPWICSKYILACKEKIIILELEVI